MILRTIVIIPLIALLLGCGLFTQDNGSTETPVTPMAGSQPLYDVTGDTSIEEKIANHPVIVRATMTSFSSDIISRDEEHRAIMEFGLNVSEYLKGSGSSSITAVWFTQGYSTREEAEAWKASILADRDARWDDREAIIFLFPDISFASEFGDRFTDKYSLGVNYYADDRYSLHSLNNKRWLPATGSRGSSSASSGSNSQEFLLDVPRQERATGEGAAGAQASSTTTPTIALSALKTRISEVTAELNGGDGSEAYKECVRAKYELERVNRYFKGLDGRILQLEKPRYSTLESGQPANTVLDERPGAGQYPSQTGRTWFEGDAAKLFRVTQVLGDPYDIDEDGKLTAGVDVIRYTESLTTARPLPAGAYEVIRKEVWTSFLPCNYALSHDWTITVIAPAGTLHEAFFDPVTIGTTVGADASNGVIDPDEFTVGSDDYEIESIVWDEDDDEVVLTLDDHVSLSGKTLDFIKLDGSIGTSLDVSNATVNQTAATWTWSLTSAPWENGDTLMLRIRNTSGTPTPTATPVPPTATSVPEGALQITVAADNTNPPANQPVNLTATVQNGPAGLQPAFYWEISFSGVWGKQGSGSTLRYLGSAGETVGFRATVTYPNGVSLTSDAVSITWPSPAGT